LAPLLLMTFLSFFLIQICYKKNTRLQIALADFCAKIPYIGRHFPRTQIWSGGHGVVRMTPLMFLLLVSLVKYDKVSSNALFSVGTGTLRSFSVIWPVGQGTGSAEMKFIVPSTRKAPKNMSENFDIAVGISI
jgi:hypothetical protein